jgi:arylsulfatase A-like enzyme
MMGLQGFSRLLTAALMLCALAGPTLAAVGGPRPNILFILVDDMEYGLLRYMPKLQRNVTEHGMEFENNFVSLPVCCPSRASTLRGQYAHNTTVWGNVYPLGGFLKVYQSGIESSTVATWLKASGYRTALVGKYMNQYPDPDVGTRYIPPGWSFWFVPNGGDTDLQYNYSVNFNGTTVRYGSQAQDHLNDVLLGQAQGFLQDAAKDPPSQPFFLMLTPTLPHLPAVAPRRYLSLFGGVKAPRPPSFNEADMSDKPTWMRSLPLLSAWQIDLIDKRYVRRRRATAALDDMVGALVQTLRDTGQLPNTYIFFTSDNGMHMGPHRLLNGKGHAYEEDIRVPLVARGPGIPAGRKVRQLAANVDLAPTFAALAGITPPDFVDGRSLVPLFSGAAPARWRQSLLLERQLIEDAKAFYGLRTANNRMFALYDNGEGEYYDMNVDPYQLQNRHDTMSTALKASLTRQVNTLRTATGAALRAAEEVAAGTTP